MPKTTKAVKSAARPRLHFLQRLATFKALMIIWLSAITVFLVWLFAAYLLPMSSSMLLLSQSSYQQTNRQMHFDALTEPLVDASQKRIILPDQELSFKHDPSLGKLNYSYSNDEEGSVLYFSTNKVTQLASSRASSVESWNQTVGQSKEDGRGTSQAELEEQRRAAYECKFIMQLSDRKYSDNEPLATINLANQTLYAYPASNRNCQEYWSNDGYGRKLEANGLLNRLVEMAKTAENVTY
jgi:hypothetical protein